MKFALSVAILLAVAGNGLAKDDPPVFEKGVLLQMESAPCGYAEKGGKTVAGEILGTDSENKKTNEVLCQEYVLQTDHVIYRIRPRDDKHPALLPLGETAEFRIEKDKMKLRVPETGQKERDYTVVSMTMRDDASSRSSAKNDKQ
jgi:hypothetical protein